MAWPPWTRQADAATTEAAHAALPDLRRAAEAADAPPGVQLRLAEFEIFALREADAAEARCRRVLGLSVATPAERAEAHALLGAALARGPRRDWHGAVAALEEALSFRETPTVLCDLAWPVAEMGDRARALQLLDRAGADSALAWRTRGLVLHHGGDPAGARAAYERCVELGDPSGQALFNLGVLLEEELGDAAGARAAYEACAALRGGALAANALLSLGTLLYASAPAEARDAYERCAALGGPLAADAQFNLGTLLQQTDSQDARAAYEACIALGGEMAGEAAVALVAGGLAPAEELAALFATAPDVGGRAWLALSEHLSSPADALERATADADPTVASAAWLALGALLHPSDESGAEAAEAQAAYERCIALRSEAGTLTGAAHFNLAVLLHTTQGEEAAPAARAAYERCIALRAERGTLDASGKEHFELGGLLQDALEDHEGARAAFAQCVAIREVNGTLDGEALFGLGSSLVALGEEEAGKEAFARSAALLEERLGAEHASTLIARRRACEG